MIWISNFLYVRLSLNKGLFKVYTIKDIKHKNDRPNAIANNSAGITISILFSFIVQIDIVVLLLDGMSFAVL